MRLRNVSQEMVDPHPRYTIWQRFGAVLGAAGIVGMVASCTADASQPRSTAHSATSSSGPITPGMNSAPRAATPTVYPLPGDHHLPPAERRLFENYGGRHDPARVVSMMVRLGCATLTVEVQKYDSAPFPDEAEPPDINKLIPYELVYNHARTLEGYPPVSYNYPPQAYDEYASATGQVCPEFSWPLTGREHG